MLKKINFAPNYNYTVNSRYCLNKTASFHNWNYIINENFTDMNNFVERYRNLTYHFLKIRIAVSDNVVFDSWVGAILRNNFLYAAHQVVIEKEHKSLFEVIETLPIAKDHPLYNELKGGFPKGYVLSPLSHADLNHSSYALKKGEILSFSLILIGNFADYFPYYVQAIRMMCEKGLGYPQRPFLLIDICEVSKSGEPYILATESSLLSDTLQHPISFSDFFSLKAKKGDETLKVIFQTPVCLVKPVPKTNTQTSFQDKNNGFPSFYQLVRSAAYRFFKLNVLYASDGDMDDVSGYEAEIDDYIANATRMQIHSVRLQKLLLKSPPQKGKTNIIPLSGYVGEMVYEGYFNHYLPLLKFMQELGVGNEVVYGLGRYRIE